MSKNATRKRHSPARPQNYFAVEGPELPKYPLSPSTIAVQGVDPAAKNVRYKVIDLVGSLESKTQCHIFARLYTDHRDFVKRTVERHGVPSRDADDMTQEVFAIALSRIKDFDAAQAARPWLFVIAIHRAANYRRLARNRVEPVASAPPPDVASDATDVESAVVDAEERTLMRELIGRLSPKLRSMLIMHDLDERPMAEIVAKLKIPLKTGQARLKLARDEVLRRGQALALSQSAIPLRYRDLLRVREVLLEYGKAKHSRRRRPLPPPQRRGPSAPLAYLVLD